MEWSDVPYCTDVKVRALLFDVYGTLIDVETDDHAEPVYRSLAYTLAYAGIVIDRAALRKEYAEEAAAQVAARDSLHADIDVVEVWRRLIDRLATDFTRALPAGRLAQLPLSMAELHRSLARKRLRAYPDVEKVLRPLRERYCLAVATDGQEAFVAPELETVGLGGLFDPIVVSSTVKYHKPDRRVFSAALEALGVDAGEALYVGNDPYRDVLGAQQAGLRAVLFRGGPFEPAPPGTALPEPDFKIAHLADLPRVIEAAERQ